MANKSQMSLDAINILKGLCYSQLLLQDEKASMVASGYFNDLDSFSQIDRKGVLKVYSQDIINYLSVHRIAASERQAQYIIWLSGSRQAFMTIQHFKNYISNGDINNMERLRGSNLHNMSTGDEIVKNFGERQLAKIYEKQIQYYRAIEVLRQDFIKKYGFQFKNIVNQIDTNKTGKIIFNNLIQFIHKHGVQFSVEEFQALCRKIASQQRNALSYKQIMKTFMPFEPLNFPTYRKQSNMNKALQYITKQISKLGIDTNTFDYRDQEQPKKFATGFQKTIQQYRNPLTKGNHMTSNFFYDQNYYNELRQYKTGFYDPNKNVKQKVQNSMIGPQYHDHFFSDYYLYLQERNKSQYYFNKFGKRYTYTNTLAATVDNKR